MSGGNNIMKRKKIWIGLIICMLFASMLTGIIGEQNAEDYPFKERRIINQKELKGVYTQHGIEKIPGTRGKPGVSVVIDTPDDGAEVSGSSVDIQVSVTQGYTPTISIDGIAVFDGTYYAWDTTQYAEGIHTIKASTRGVTDIHTVTVSNGGGTNNPPTADFTYVKTDLTVAFTDQSYDSDGTIIGRYWEFGDGDTSTDVNPVHTYSVKDTYTVSLTVTDNDCATGSTLQSVIVSSGSGSVNKYALVIGISNYLGRRYDLQYCDDDAQDWKSFLEDEGYSVTILLDNQATGENIITGINNLLNVEDSDDYVVFAYSGHGSTISGYGSCIVEYKLYGIDHGYIESLFAGADSEHIFFSFDACVIGDFQGLVTNNRVGAFASEDRSSYDGDSWMQNGVFTYYQMEGWNSYSDFEQDSIHAIQGMENWASSKGYIVDPFHVDHFSGSMIP